MTVDPETEPESPLRRILSPGLRGNQLLRFALLVVGIPPTLYAFHYLFIHIPLGVDMEIPLQAAQRWVSGEVVYDPASFAIAAGPGLPFLYPPFLLPFLVPLLLLPAQVVLGAWVLTCLAASAWALRRLCVPWPWVPLLLASPPFAEGILAGNVQVVLFALFVAMFIARAAAPPFQPPDRDPAGPEASLVRDGLLASLIAMVKASQLHPWVYLLRRRWRSAILGAAMLGAVVLATVPITGLALWSDWLQQVQRAADPAWANGGFGLDRYLGATASRAIAIACVLAVLFVPRRDAGAWVGILSVVGSIYLRTFGLLFLLPAGLRIRRELGLAAFALIGTYTVSGMWAGIVIVVVGFTLGSRFAALREPKTTERAIPLLAGRPERATATAD
jgi:hypothetical protein